MARDDVQLTGCLLADPCRDGPKGLKGNESFQGVRCQISSRTLVTVGN